jgi:hypothetical protein
MPNVKTDEQKFLDWCEKRQLKFKFKKTQDKDRHYELNFDHKAVLVIQGVTFKLNKLQHSDSINVYFGPNGRWYGGTNIIWNTGLPWTR